MDKQEHAEMLRRAIEESTHDRQAIADAVDRSYRTVGNWISPTSPTMPNAAERKVLRTILGDYDHPGDGVERAIKKSELVDWRQDAVLSVYKKNLREQREERAG